MKRFCSQFTFCSPSKILRQTVIEQNQENIITDIFNLNNLHSETSHTLFLDGIISNEIFSLKEHLKLASLQEIRENYQYIDLSENNISILEPYNNPLVIDFGTSSTERINQILKNSFLFLHKFSIMEIIAACTYYPLLIANRQPVIEPGSKSNLILWRGVNLVTKKITDKIKIERISSNI